MARKGIGYDKVAEAADKMFEYGIQPTVRKIRDKLATGSPNTIDRHLKEWEKAQPRQKPSDLTETTESIAGVKLQAEGETIKIAASDKALKASEKNSLQDKKIALLQKKIAFLEQQVSYIMDERDNLRCRLNEEAVGVIIRWCSGMRI